MNLQKKFVLLRVKEGAAHLFDPSAPGGDLLLFGTVAGETANVGLWVSVLLWGVGDGIDHKPPRMDAPHLIPWASIRSAAILPDGTDPKAFGFKVVQ